MDVNALMNCKKSVLKLVPPGGVVELHQKPIMVTKVLRKNPRHFVTHPDVFKYPWIVVRPETVFEPGKVFYVVPPHTIYPLLQSKRYSGNHLTKNRYDNYTYPNNVTSNLGDHDQHRSKLSEIGQVRYCCSPENIDPQHMMKRENHHDCEKAETCNLGEYDQRNVLSDSVAPHLSNQLAAKKHWHDWEGKNLHHQQDNLLRLKESSRYREHGKGGCQTTLSANEITKSHLVRRQPPKSAEKSECCQLKVYDTENQSLSPRPVSDYSAILKSNKVNWRSHCKETSGQYISGYDSSSSEVTMSNGSIHECDKQSCTSPTNSWKGKYQQIPVFIAGPQ